MPEQTPFNLTRLGWGLAIPVLFLSLVGLACIHATDRSAAPLPTIANGADQRSDDASWAVRTYRAIGHNTSRQLVFLISGFGVMLLTLIPSYQKVGKYAYLAYGITIMLLILLVLDRYVDLPLIPVRKDTRRWISLGAFSIQPSEFMKPILILTLARYLRFRSSYRRWGGLIAPFLLTLVPMALIIRQPDLGTTLMLLPVLFAMLFVAGARAQHLLVVILLGCASLPLFYVFGMKPYQQQRIQAVFKQDTDDPQWQRGPGYQLRQSKIALGTGGLAGQGYGEGMFVRYDGLLPEEHNDSIFAIIGHQWGLAGALLVLLAYGVIVVVGLEVPGITNDPFGRLLAVGVIVMIVVQALLNICMTIGLAPITGMTLPFVSYGGSSLWANFLGLGLLVNIAQRRPMLIAHKPFEHKNVE